MSVSDAGHLVAWPRSLREFLNGTARITLRVHSSPSSGHRRRDEKRLRELLARYDSI